MIVIAGSASPKLAARVAEALECPLTKPELKRFPDGELYVRVGADLEGEHAVIVQSTRYPQNDNLIELSLLLDATKDLGAKRVTAVVPYLAYSRQDKRFKPGEAISIRTVCKLLERAGADDFFTVDLHQDEIIRNFSIPAHNLTAMPLLGRYIAGLELRDPIILGADQGSLERARRVAAESVADYDYLEKKRITSKRVVIRPKRLEVSKRDIVVIDDIISTGGTIIEAAKMLKRQGARKIISACTHGVFAGNALQKILAAKVKQVIATDTIESRASVVSSAPVIVDAIGRF